MMMMIIIIIIYQYRFFTYDHSTYEYYLKFLMLHTLHNKRLYLDALFVFLFTEIYNAASLFLISMLFELFLVILETNSFPF